MNRIVTYFRNNLNPRSLFNMPLLRRFAYDTFTHPRRTVMPLPTNIQLEPTTRCNFNCVYCRRHTYPPERSNLSIPYENLVKLLDENPQLRIMTLTGLGEPFLATGFADIVEEVKSRGIQIRTATNGSLLNSSSVIDVALKFNSIIISFDTGDPRLFESTRRNSNYHSIMSGVKNLIEQRNRLGNGPNVQFYAVISHLNYKSIPTLYDAAVELGVDGVGLNQALNHYTSAENEYPEMREFSLRTRALTTVMYRMGKELRSKLNKKGISLAMAFRPHEKPYVAKCRWCFDTAFITADGYLTPCCMRTSPEIFNFGNVFQTRLKDLWNGENYKVFRSTMISGLRNGICDGCPIGS